MPLEVGRTSELVRAFEGAEAAFLLTPPIALPATHEFELGKQRRTPHGKRG